MSRTIDLQNQYEFDVYPKRDLVINRGKGAKVWDENGREFIDCIGGIAVASVGHANENVVKAISDQAAKLITCPGIFYNETKAKFLEKLISIAPHPLKRAFITNSGTEAVEAALKFARFSTGKTDFICAMKGFHGRTFGAMSATFKKEYREIYEPNVPGFSFVPFNNIEKLKDKVTDKTAAIMLEVVQGEGGINIGEKEYLKEVNNFCKANGILLIVDEIQTGFGRTGKMFASEYYEIEPDMMTVAKAIAGGFPLGAVLCAESVQIPKGKHGSTFGGNPLACAAGLAAMDFITANDLPQKAKDSGEYFIAKLRDIKSDKIRDIRGLGLIIGIELKEKVQPYILKLMEENILTLPAGVTVLRLVPPLVITNEEIDLVVEKLSTVLA
ncbi:MAG: acetylornithine/succinylornithine family transaminase [Melioribacteraceae bacterium]|nr:acetylornithine/succinylornithine family transaminase [Melioribacteraceae bacterium]